MHGDTGHEVRCHLARYELAGVRVAGILSCLLRRQLRELLCDQVMVLREPLQQIVLRLLRQRGIDLLWISQGLLPCTDVGFNPYRVQEK